MEKEIDIQMKALIAEKKVPFSASFLMVSSDSRGYREHSIPLKAKRSISRGRLLYKPVSNLFE
ncbi:MAG TPA: hypothetical protein DCR93_13855 [Cytophagales bacterium]|nr:hypothetical protein [Cytophagales bacterium]HAP60524.1 hypothetical protein [Cytophagales bacterium]